jgi:hypothetical protein
VSGETLERLAMLPICLYRLAWTTGYAGLDYAKIFNDETRSRGLLFSGLTARSPRVTLLAAAGSGGAWARRSSRTQLRPGETR